MSALQTVTTAETKALDAVFPDWRAFVAPAVWALYDQLDPETPLVTLRKWGISVTVRVKHARRALVLLLGERS